MQQERTHSGASAKKQKRLVQGITIGGLRMWNSAYASIKRGPAHANLKRVLAACPLRAICGHSPVGSYGISATFSKGCGRTWCAEVSTRRRFRRVQRATRLRVLMRQDPSNPALLSGGGRRQLGRRMRLFTRDAEALFHSLAQLLECDVEHRHQEDPDRTRG